MSGGNLTVRFKVDTKWLQLPGREVPEYREGVLDAARHPLYREGELGRVYARKELARFTYIDKVTNGQEAYKKRGGSTRDYILEVVSKVIAVILSTLSVLMPLAFCYLPAWVPFGIGLPVILVLSIVQSQIKARIEIYKREQEFLPNLSRFVQKSTFKDLKIIGKEDLPVMDERLKSDEMMHADKIKQVKEGKRPLLEHPISPDSRFDLDAPSYQKHRVATIASRYDLEISPYLLQAVAAEYAGMPHKREKWEKVLNVQCDILAGAREGYFKEFSKKIEKKQEMAYEASQLPNSPLVDYPTITLRSDIESRVQLYNRFYLKLERLESLRKEGEALYGTAPEGWQQYLDLAEEAKAELEECEKKVESLEESLDAPILVPDFKPHRIFYRLNGETCRIEEQLLNWIAAHPSKRHKAIQAKLDSYIIQEMPTKEESKRLATWIDKHPLEADQTIVHLGLKFPMEFKTWMNKNQWMHFETPRDLCERFDLVRKSFPDRIQEVLTGQQLGVVFANWVKQHPDQIDRTIMDLVDHFPEELKGWIEKHPQMRFETARDLFHYSIKAVECFQAARRAFKDLKVETEAIDTFEKTMMIPLAVAIAGQSEAVEFKQKFKATFMKLPTIPFAKVPKKFIREKPSALKSRKIEEISLNKLLREFDSQMLFTNRARNYVLCIRLIALFTIEGIVACYFATPWLFWGLCVLAALGEGVSYYVDRKLEEMERKKQAIKLQHILRDHPEIDVIPGTKPHLQTLKEVQRKYGLEGVRPTWARILTEESGTPLETAGNHAEAVEATRDLAEEGSGLAAAYLEDALLNLYSQKNALQALNKNEPTLEGRIESMEKVLYPEEETREPKKLTPKEKLTKELREVAEKQREESQKQYQQRHQLEKELDGLTKHALYETNQMAILNCKQSHFDVLAQILPPDLLEKILSKEAIEEYLGKVDPSQKKRHAQALYNLAILQADQAVPTPSTLKAQLEKIQDTLKKIKDRRSQLLQDYCVNKIHEINAVIADVNSQHVKISKKFSENPVEETQKELKQNRAHYDSLLKALEEYQSGLLKSCYVPLVRERQLVGEALDKLAEKKIYMETKCKEFGQVSRRFAWLERLLTPQFVKEPVLQAEIDLLLKTLEMEPLELDSTIDVRQLLWDIKEKLSSFWTKFLSFEEEMSQLLKLPPAHRLILAKLLRKLQILQNDKDYKKKTKVDKKLNVTKARLKEIQEEMTLLMEKYGELSKQIRSESPADWYKREDGLPKQLPWVSGKKLL